MIKIDVIFPRTAESLTRQMTRLSRLKPYQASTLKFLGLAENPTTQWEAIDQTISTGTTTTTVRRIRMRTEILETPLFRRQFRTTERQRGAVARLGFNHLINRALQKAAEVNVEIIPDPLVRRSLPRTRLKKCENWVDLGSLRRRQRS